MVTDLGEYMIGLSSEEISQIITSGVQQAAQNIMDFPLTAEKNSVKNLSGAIYGSISHFRRDKALVELGKIENRGRAEGEMGQHAFSMFHRLIYDSFDVQGFDQVLKDARDLADRVILQKENERRVLAEQAALLSSTMMPFCLFEGSGSRKDAWGGNTAGEGEFCFDGTMIIVTNAIQPKTRSKTYQAEARGETSSSQDKARAGFSKLTATATEPLEELGWQTVGRVDLVFYVTGVGDIVTINPKKVLLLQSLTGANSARVTPALQVVFYLDDQPVGAIMSIKYTGPDIDVDVARNAVLENLKSSVLTKSIKSDTINK